VLECLVAATSPLCCQPGCCCCCCCCTLSPAEGLKANPDAWNLKLDTSGNLPSTILDPLKNDTGFIAIARLVASGIPADNLKWNNETNYYTYSITGYQ
jgi:hypothetical protein